LVEWCYVADAIARLPRVVEVEAIVSPDDRRRTNAAT
jgi:hypothetical protein